jgi:probable phosphoglycerate mutase
MVHSLSRAYLVRHGATAWSASGQHTGLTDLPLTAAGEAGARSLGQRLQTLSFDQVLTSPLQRATRTCDLVGLLPRARIDPDLVEWNYGDYEGQRTTEILARRPGWNVFRDGCPGGESPPEILARAMRVVQRLRSAAGNAVIFSSGHFLRVLAACWLGLDASAGALWILDTASLSAVGYEHDRTQPVIRFWNDTTHLNR